MTNAKITIAIGLATATGFLVPIASASAHKFEQSQAKYPAKYEEKSIAPQEFTFETIKIKCAKASYTGELKEASETIKLVPAYQECTVTSLEGIEAKTKIEHCEDKVKVTTETEFKKEEG